MPRLVVRTETEVRAAFAAARTNAGAGKILGCSGLTAGKLGLAYGLKNTTRGRLKTKPAPPAPKEKRPEPTQQEIMDGLLLHQSIVQAAAQFERSTPWLDARIRRWNLHSYTGRPRIADPVVQRLDVERAVIERAVKLGIWHIDRNGELQQHDRADPYRGRGPNLFDRKRA